MKKKFMYILIACVVVGLTFVGYLYFSTPTPTTFEVVDSPLKINIGVEKQFLKELYPDESFLTYSCKCEDESIAKVEENKESITELKKGKTILVCEARNKKLAEIEVIVE